MKDENQSDVYQIVVKNMITTLSDMTKILEATSVENFEEVIEEMCENLPNMRTIPTATKIETLQKTIQNLTRVTPNLTDPSPTINNNIQSLIEDMVDTTVNMIDVFAIINGYVLQKTMRNVRNTFPQMTKIFSQIDWTTFQPTDKDLKRAQKILNSENIEQAVAESFRERKATKELSNSFRTVLLVLMLLYYTMEFISNTTLMTVRELTHNKIHPVIESTNRENSSKQKNSSKQSSEELKEVLKEKIPTEILGVFMIVTHDQLTIHEIPNESSKIVGTVNSSNIVQFVEQEREWIRIIHDSTVDDSISEGWVLMKHLKRIK